MSRVGSLHVSDDGSMATLTDDGVTPVSLIPPSIEVTVCRLSCPCCGQTAYREVTWEEHRDYRLGSWVCDCGDGHDLVEHYDDGPDPDLQADELADRRTR